MTTTEKWPGRVALMVGHCAGMVDLVALPVWVGALISFYGFDPQQAGGLVSLFLIGAVAASLYFAPRFNRLNRRLVAALGFGGAALAFGMASLQTGFAAMAICHAAAGLAVGSALSVTHGTIGRAANPHRMFAMVGLALGIFAIGFMGATPNLVAALGGAVLFKVFAGVMAVAAIVSALLFPLPDHEQGTEFDIAHPRLSGAVWAGMIGVGLMGVNQAMVFSFFERIGADRGYGVETIAIILVAVGFVNLIAPPLAVFLERRIGAQRVVMTGPAVQAVLALVITTVVAFPAYAGAGSVFVFVMIFTHTFAFGLLSRLDPSGRALAATPAMLMIGAAVGPILGGTLVKFSGYPAIGVAVVICASLAIVSFSRARLQPVDAVTP
ncbi:MFS transporter [Pseudophaeobacter arcticus]|uniref:MFS transporter n=1 Tax=Pseudophaeobacter arcticus TaxID=385492 RepID=UPI000561E085|nr:MFS transporter [Pseudophaeobacter arcticus]